MKYQYLIEFEAESVCVAEKLSRGFNNLLDVEHASIKHSHCWRRDGEEISQIPFEAQKQSATPINKQSESLLCPKCQSNVIHYSVVDKDYWCDDCHNRWEA